MTKGPHPPVKASGGQCRQGWKPRTRATRASRVAGAWRAEARFRDSDGITRKVRRTGPTAGAARAALTTALRDRADRVHDGTITRDSTIAELNAEWQKWKAAKVAAASMTRYEQVSRAYIVPKLGGLRIHEGTVPRLDRFLTDVTDEVGAPTAKHCRNVLTGMWAWAVRHGAAQTSTARDTEPPAVVVESPRALTVAELAKLRAAATVDQDVADYIAVALGTAGRIGDVLDLTWPDVDLKAATVTLTEDKKSDRRLIRHVPPFTVAALLARQVRMTHGTSGNLVFPNSAGEPFDPSNFRKRWRPIAKAAGVPWATPHTLRKTVATVLDRDASAEVAAAQLGHSKLDMTRRHYIERGIDGPQVGDLLEQALGVSAHIPPTQAPGAAA